MSNVVMTKRATFTHLRARWVTIEVSSGEVELYRVDPADGIEMFQGYLTAPTIPSAVRLKAVRALYAYGGRRLDFYRPCQISLFA